MSYYNTDTKNKMMWMKKEWNTEMCEDKLLIKWHFFNCTSYVMLYNNITCECWIGDKIVMNYFLELSWYLLEVEVNNKNLSPEYEAEKLTRWSQCVVGRGCITNSRTLRYIQRDQSETKTLQDIYFLLEHFIKWKEPGETTEGTSRARKFHLTVNKRCNLQMTHINKNKLSPKEIYLLRPNINFEDS
jgi:hypothetical protein